MKVNSLFRITPGLREKHNYRWDTAYQGDYLCRLPDGRLVRAADYAQALKAYERSRRK
ncbi:MAG: hypothetical protein AAGA23_19840 [Pseudomonadota bacterium]